MNKKDDLFLVEYDDGHGLSYALSWDEECKGAICSDMGERKVALFGSKSAARTAIKISTKLAQLKQAQDEPCDDSFVAPYKKHLHIRLCILQEPQS